MVVFHHSARRLLLLVWSTVSLAHHAQAQLLTTSGVDITVGTGVAVTVEGAVQLNAASTITNQGELRVQGDWTNNTGNTGLTASSNGTVHLFGSAPQGIAGSSITDFRHLRLTGGIKQLLQNAVVRLPGQPDGTLELGSGCALLLENQTFTVFDPLGTAVVDNGGWVASESLNSRFQWALGNDVTPSSSARCKVTSHASVGT